MSARRAACDLVIAVLDRGRAMEDALEQSAAFNALEGRDRAFARAIASTTLRRLGSIDGVLARFLSKPIPDNATAARAILRTGAAQILFLETPPHAAVSQAVELANGHRALSGFAGLINAVLRRVANEGAAIVAALPAGSDLPRWLYARWRAAYGDAQAAQIAGALLEEAPLDLSVKDDAAGWAARLGAEVLPTGSLRLHASAEAERAPPPAPSPQGGGVISLPGFGEGAWWVQDAAAALPAQLLGDVRGKRVLDLCAAPGGKTLQLAAAGAVVTALDKDEARLGRLREGLARTGLSAEVVCADALTWEAPEPFDAVLLDAPCSSTGTLRRHPDVAWLRRPSDVPALAALQAQLLGRAAAYVRPGGVLVYAVCSLEPEEGPSVIANAGATWRLEAIDAPAEFARDGALRTLPSDWRARGGLDGFYAVRLVRV